MTAEQEEITVLYHCILELQMASWMLWCVACNLKPNLKVWPYLHFSSVV